MEKQSELVTFVPTFVTRLDGRHIHRMNYGDGRFIYQSFGKTTSIFGEIQIEPHTTFLADGGHGVAAEWEPRHGPIQVWHECLKEDENARQHWHFDYVNDGWGNWSQLAVEHECLPQKLLAGDLDAVFEVLLRWAQP